MKTKRKNIKVGRMKALFFTVFIFFCCFNNALFAQSELWKEDRQISMRMSSIINTHIRIVSRWVQNPVLINSVIKQNQKKVPMEEIMKIEKQWPLVLLKLQCCRRAKCNLSHEDYFTNL